jgi:hypothetical protein
MSCTLAWPVLPPSCTLRRPSRRWAWPVASPRVPTVRFRVQGLTPAPNACGSSRRGSRGLPRHISRADVHRSNVKPASAGQSMQAPGFDERVLVLQNRDGNPTCLARQDHHRPTSAIASTASITGSRGPDLASPSSAPSPHAVPDEFGLIQPRQGSEHPAAVACGGTCPFHVSVRPQLTHTRPMEGVEVLQRNPLARQLTSLDLRARLDLAREFANVAPDALWGSRACLRGRPASGRCGGGRE